VRQVLADRERTAWVCVNDDLAIYCLDCLQAAGVAVPREISVVGFDDTLDATRRRLTTYNFNNYGVVRACLEHILRPRTGLPRPRRRGAMEIDGYVVLRQTTGPVRREGADTARPATS
jgi:DNA-binding LacI/PurR family transcriptional regulator